MEELDGDEVRVSSRGRVAERDIVQVMLPIQDYNFFLKLLEKIYLALSKFNIIHFAHLITFNHVRLNNNNNAFNYHLTNN